MSFRSPNRRPERRWNFSMKVTVDEAALKVNRLSLNFKVACEPFKELLDAPVKTGSDEKQFVCPKVSSHFRISRHRRVNRHGVPCWSSIHHPGCIRRRVSCCGGKRALSAAVRGYYDAGDNRKFGFPMAFTTTMLS